MMNFTDLTPDPSNRPAPFIDQLRLAVAAYLARFKGSSRGHTEWGLRCFLAWCAERRLDPLAARRPHLELYIRRMQEIRRFKPSTVSRRFFVAAGFYRTCVIGGLLEQSPAEHVRRPAVPGESASRSSSAAVVSSEIRGEPSAWGPRPKSAAMQNNLIWAASAMTEIWPMFAQNGSARVLPDVSCHSARIYRLTWLRAPAIGLV